jgi:hypothetical protein
VPLGPGLLLGHWGWSPWRCLGPIGEQFGTEGWVRDGSISKEQQAVCEQRVTKGSMTQCLAAPLPSMLLCMQLRSQVTVPIVLPVAASRGLQSSL